MFFRWKSTVWIDVNYYNLIILETLCSYYRESELTIHSVLSGELSHSYLIVFELTRPGLDPTIYNSQGDNDNYYPTDVFKDNNMNKNISHCRTILKSYIESQNRKRKQKQYR